MESEEQHGKQQAQAITKLSPTGTQHAVGLPVTIIEEFFAGLKGQHVQ
jgi:hypothetical protein